MSESTLTELLTGSGDLSQRAKALESYSAETVLAAALNAFRGRIALSTAFGAGGLCVLHMAQSVDPEIEAYTIDTGFLFPETQTLMDTWTHQRNLRLNRVLPVLTPEAQEDQHGPALWTRNPDQCCAIRKVEPNQRALRGKALWITALRRDESASRAHLGMLQEATLQDGQKLLKLCPIITWTKKQVWNYIFEQKLPYNPLHDQGYPSIGCTHCTQSVKPGEDERAGRWAGRGKLECGLHLPAAPETQES